MNMSNVYTKSNKIIDSILNNLLKNVQLVIIKDGQD